MENSTELREYAKERYFYQVIPERYRENFIKKLSQSIVVDKRSEGNYCHCCGKFSIKSVMPMGDNATIFPKVDGQIWVVNRHYDGCLGWE